MEEKERPKKEVLITDEFIPNYSLPEEEREKQIKEYIEEITKAFSKLGL